MGDWNFFRPESYSSAANRINAYTGDINCNNVALPYFTFGSLRLYMLLYVTWFYRVVYDSTYFYTSRPRLYVLLYAQTQTLHASIRLYYVTGCFYTSSLRLKPASIRVVYDSTCFYTSSLRLYVLLQRVDLDSTCFYTSSLRLKPASIRVVYDSTCFYIEQTTTLRASTRVLRLYVLLYEQTTTLCDFIGWSTTLWLANLRKPLRSSVPWPIQFEYHGRQTVDKNQANHPFLMATNKTYFC